MIDHLGEPDLRAANSWTDFRKMFRLKRFPQVWVSASEPCEISLTKKYPYRDTYPFYKAVYEEFGGKQLIWGTGYPMPRWELPMNKELEFVDKFCDFYTVKIESLFWERMLCVFGNFRTREGIRRQETGFSWRMAEGERNPPFSPRRGGRI